MTDFGGVKLALICNQELIAIQRDNIPNISFPGMWDFPGGQRDGQETPFRCIQREVEEELGIQLRPEHIVWEKIYPAMVLPNEVAYFMAAEIPSTMVERIKFGNEGQGWKLMPFQAFLDEPNAVPPLKLRLKDYLEARQRT